MLDRLLSLLVAVCLAILIWLYARCREQETLDNVPITVQVSLTGREAEHYELEVTGPSQVPVSFIGPPSRMRELRTALQNGDMIVRLNYSVPVERQAESRCLDTLRVRAEDLHPPPGVRALVLEGQNRIPITVRRLAERVLPVRLEHALQDRLVEVQLNPASVVVRGPQEVLDNLYSIPTRPYVLPERVSLDQTQDITVRSTVRLVNDILGRPITVTPSVVAAKLTLAPLKQVYEIETPVQFLCPAGYRWQPRWVKGGEKAGYIKLRLIGPAPIPGQTAEPPAVYAFVDLTSRGFQGGPDWLPQTYTDEPIRLQLPRDFQLDQPLPRSEAFRLVPLPRERELPGGLPWP
jgi:hypothetical protein